MAARPTPVPTPASTPSPKRMPGCAHFVAKESESDNGGAVERAAWGRPS